MKTGYSQRQWEGKFFRCQMMCWYCRVPLTLAEAEKDHLTPLSRGGEDEIRNIVPACGPCNRLKGELTEEEFREQRHHLCTLAGKLPASPFSSQELVVGEEEILRRQLERERLNLEWWRQ